MITFSEKLNKTKLFARQLSNPDKRDKCLHQIFFLLKNKKKISKALKGEGGYIVSSKETASISVEKRLHTQSEKFLFDHNHGNHILRYFPNIRVLPH